MNNQERGSEKLPAGCAGPQILSQRELEQIAGAGLLSSPMGVWKVFPRGVPWPEVFATNELGAVKQPDGATSGLFG